VDQHLRIGAEAGAVEKRAALDRRDIHANSLAGGDGVERVLRAVDPQVTGQVVQGAARQGQQRRRARERDLRGRRHGSVTARDPEHLGLARRRFEHVVQLLPVVEPAEPRARQVLSDRVR
jgi:hypothetical protein